MSSSSAATASAPAGGSGSGNENGEGICVAIRARPLNSKEKIQGQRALWRCLPAHNSITLTGPDGNPMPDRNPGFTFFTYDKVFSENATTGEVYKAIGSPIVSSVLQGFNGTIFAYGQTSSGKTFTMVGDDEHEQGGEEGVLHLAARDIFRLISETQDRDFLLRVSFVEIYNENIRDLLDPETPSLAIREDPRKGVYIEAHESIITDFASILTALKTGSKHRRVEATAMNERSSRSHTIFRIVVESKGRPVAPPAGAGAAEEGGAAATAATAAPATTTTTTTTTSTGNNDVDGAVLVATLNLVDLAGSESVRHTGATGNRAKEGGKINQSLLTLSRVIHALGQDSNTHKGFRDSKLTRILQPSLSGNAKMAVVCCITAAEKYLEETRSTLQFASRAKMVRTRAVVNEVLDDRAQLKRLKKELQELKEKQKMLEEMERESVAVSVGGGGGGGGGAGTAEEMTRLEAEKQMMTGKVEELEAVREEQANKIARLKTLILHGGGMMAAAGGVGGVEMGGGLGGGVGGGKNRRHKRTRETWCPGESGVPLPPGALAKSLQELVEEGGVGGVDDSFVSKLSFAARQSKRRSSMGGGDGGGGGGGLVDMEALVEGSEDGDMSRMSMNASGHTAETMAAAQAAMVELVKVRELLFAGQGGEEEEEEEEEKDLVTLVKELMVQAAAGAAAASRGAAAGAAGAGVMSLEEGEEDDMGDATVQLPSMDELTKLRVLMEEKDDAVEALTEERDLLQAEVASKIAELEAANKALEEAVAAKPFQQEEEEEDNTVMMDPEMQRLIAGMAERDAEMVELRAAVAAAEEAGEGKVKKVLEEREGEMASMREMMAERDAELVALRASLAEAEGAAGLEGEVASLRQALEETKAQAVSDAEVAAAAAAVAATAAMEEEMGTLREELEQAQLSARTAEETIKAQEEDKQAIIDSRSEMIAKMEAEHEVALGEVQAKVVAMQAAKTEALKQLDALTAAKEVEDAQAKERREQGEAALEDMRAQCARLEGQVEEVKGKLEFVAAEREALVEEAAGYERTSAGLLREMEAVKEQATQQAGVLEELAVALRGYATVDAAVAGEGDMETQEAEQQEGGGEAPAATTTTTTTTTTSSPSMEELVQCLMRMKAQLEARVATVETELRGHAQENAGLKEKLGKAFRRRVSSLPPLDGEEGESEKGDLHEQLMRALRHRARGVAITTTDAAEGMEEDAAAAQGGDEVNAEAEVEKEKEEEEDEKETYGLVQRVADMGEEMDQLEEQVEMLTEALQGKEAELVVAQTQLKEKEEECARLAEELLVVEEKATESDVKAEEALCGMATKALEATTMRQRAEQLVVELEEVKASAAAAAAAAAAALEEQQQQHEQQQQQMLVNEDETVMMQSVGAAAAAQLEVEALTAELEELRAQVVEKDGKVVALGAEVQALQEQQQQQQAQEEEETTSNISKMQAQLLNEKNARAEAETALATATADLTQARAEVRQAEEKVEESRRALEEAQEVARKEHERVDNELAVREAEVGVLKEEVEKMKGEMKLAQESLSRTASAAEGSVQEDASLRKKLSQVQTQLDLAEGLVGKHEARVKELEGENNRVIREAEDEVKKLRGELERASKGQAQSSAREAETQGLLEAHAALTKKVTALKVEKEEAEERANAAADAVEALEKEVEELRVAAAAVGEAAGAVGQVEQLRQEVEEARGQEADVRQELAQLQVRQKRQQKEVEALRGECTQAREEYEKVCGEKTRLEVELAAAAAAAAAATEKEEEEQANNISPEEMEALREQLTAKEAEIVRLSAAATDLEAAHVRVQELSTQFEGLQAHLVEMEGELEKAKASVQSAEGSKSDLLKELNTLFEAKFEAETRVSGLEDEVDMLKKAVAEAKGAAEAAGEDAEVVEELRAQLAQKDGEGYRMKRELAELKEAAEAAEEAMGTQLAQVKRLQAEARAKDERIKKLDAVKLTTDQVEKLRKIKAEHAEFSKENKSLRQELEVVRQQVVSRQASVEKGASAAMEAQSKTIAELMSVREELQGKLQEAMAACRKLELERLSVRETLQELPYAPEGEEEEEDGEGGGGNGGLMSRLGFEGDVPEDLGVAVGVLVEKVRGYAEARQKGASRGAEDRALLLQELQTLTAEKEALKGRVEELEMGVDGAQELEGELTSKYTEACKKIRALEGQVEAAAAKARDAALDRQAAQEETTRNIRFLEKENLELMMESKKLKEAAVKLQAEVEVLRGQGGGGGGGKEVLRPVQTNVVMGGNSGNGHEEVMKPTLAASAGAAAAYAHTHAHTHASASAITSGGGDAALSMADKENMAAAFMMGGGGVSVGENLMGVKDDETAPPFRSMNEDDTVAGNEQCKQS